MRKSRRPWRKWLKELLRLRPMRFPMLTKIMKWVSIAALLLAVLRLPTGSYQALLEIVVCMSGLLAATQAVRAGKYFWATGFVAIAVLFNPVVPVALARRTFLWLDLVCLMTFL